MLAEQMFGFRPVTLASSSASPTLIDPVCRSKRISREITARNVANVSFHEAAHENEPDSLQSVVTVAATG